MGNLRNTFKPCKTALMKIWVYTIAYNESHFVKNFLRAYKDADKIIVYDNMSTDNTVALLREDPRVEVRIHDSGGQIRDDLYLQVKNNCWKEARGIADWVIIVDFDEILSGLDILKNDSAEPDMAFMLKHAHIIIPNGFMIFSENMPMYEDYNPLSLPLKGIPDSNSNKPCCFRPDKVSEINYNPGCHTANLKIVDDRAIVSLHSIHFKLLHFKYVNIEVYFKRLADYNKRMSDFNLQHGYGIHYTWSFEEHQRIYMQAIEDSQPINLSE
jgi:glycosyltransferase involved in cell wall biosynthesis